MSVLSMLLCCVVVWPMCHAVTLGCLLVPGQPSKFQIGEVSDTSIELTWEPAFDKEGIISYELRYKEGSQGSQVH